MASKAIEYVRTHPRTTIDVKAQLSESSRVCLEGLLGKNKSNGTWYDVTVPEAVTLTVQPHMVTRRVRVARSTDGTENFNRDTFVEPVFGSDLIEFTLSPGTKLSVVDGDSDVLAFVPDYMSDGRVGQLTFRSAGVVVFAPYTGGI